MAPYKKPTTANAVAVVWYLELEAMTRDGKNTSGHRTKPFRSRLRVLWQ